MLAVGNDRHWRRFCAGFGLDPDRPGFATNQDRVVRREELIALIEQAFANSKAADLLDQLAEIGIPAGKVRSLDEVYSWEQTRSQGLLVDVEHATLGAITLPGPPLRFFEASGAEHHPRRHLPPPYLDQHGSAIRSWLDGN